MPAFGTENIVIPWGVAHMPDIAKKSKSSLPVQTLDR